ncbi:MAG: M67 family metallopeptidase [Acidimicrobiia bacterium]
MTSAPPESPFVLRLTRAQHETVIDHCVAGLPHEACGLLVGPWSDGMPVGPVSSVVPCDNADQSAMTFSIAPKDMLRVMRDAEDAGNDIAGTWHSHTHTDAYPSPTDVRQAVDANWTYVIVSLAFGDPVLRGFHIRDGNIAEIQVVIATE